MHRELKELSKKIGTSDSSFVKVLGTMMRFLPKTFQLQLINVRKDRTIHDLIKKVQKEKGFTMWPDELAFLYSLASTLKSLDGDFAEVGVYRGGSAKVICEAKGDKPLNLFDTFSGLPKPGSFDEYLSEGQLTESLSNVERYLSNYKKVFFYPGVFPADTAKFVTDRYFSFVHLDVDFYDSTLECLRFFYPRMVGGGGLVSHDFSTLLGVRKAFDDFFLDKQELVIELPTSQCLVIKR